MSADRQIYLLNPKELSPETIAVAFAKTSRSPQSFREIAADLTEEQSAQFHEKWVVGYGHASVAEHAILHLAVENVSRLAIEILESNRLASYTEKSTRYQKWDAEAFHRPAELQGHPLMDVFARTCEMLFETYLQSLPAVREVIARQEPKREGESDAAWDRRVRSRYVDVSRYLLPAAALANVGMTANARVLEHAICKMLSHPLEEVREVGKEIKQVAQAEVPTLVKYANRLPYLDQTCQSLGEEALHLAARGNGEETDWCNLVDFDPAGEQKILAAALVRFGEVSFPAALAYLKQAGEKEQARLGRLLLGGLEEHDIPLRELEHTLYTFDVVVDQGAYFELKRHRMMTQTPQNLTAHLGYAIPTAIVEAGFDARYCEAMDAAREAYEQIARFNPFVASYLVPNGYNRRVLLTLNLRTAFHLCELRSASNAHFGMRRLAQRMAEQIRAVHPILGAYLKANPAESWDQVEEKYFHST